MFYYRPNKNKKFRPIDVESIEDARLFIKAMGHSPDVCVIKTEEELASEGLEIMTYKHEARHSDDINPVDALLYK